MSKNPKNRWKLMKIAKIDREFFHIFWMTKGILMKFSGKMWLMTILKVTKNQGFTLPASGNRFSVYFKQYSFIWIFFSASRNHTGNSIFEKYLISANRNWFSGWWKPFCFFHFQTLPPLIALFSRLMETYL